MPDHYGITVTTVNILHPSIGNTTNLRIKLVDPKISGSMKCPWLFHSLIAKTLEDKEILFVNGPDKFISHLIATFHSDIIHLCFGTFLPSACYSETYRISARIFIYVRWILFWAGFPITEIPRPSFYVPKTLISKVDVQWFNTA